MWNLFFLFRPVKKSDIAPLSPEMMAEHMGAIQPANDMMAGMIILYAEVFGLILFIFSAILILLYLIVEWNTSISFWNIFKGFAPQPCEFHEGTWRVAKISPNEDHLIIKRSMHFTKEQEMLLDMAFLIFPTLAIVYILVPTLGFIFNNDFSNIDTYIDVNVIGHQWYWTYEYNSNLCVTPGFANLNIETSVLQMDSFMDTDATINRLLEVTNRLVIPTGYFVGLHITASDVIHSFALPQIGIKVDAIPGRIAQLTVFLSTSGVYRGQCSELCGAYHGFMPIVLESIPVSHWYDWYCFSISSSPATTFLNSINSNGILTICALVKTSLWTTPYALLYPLVFQKRRYTVSSKKRLSLSDGIDFVLAKGWIVVLLSYFLFILWSIVYAEFVGIQPHIVPIDPLDSVNINLYVIQYSDLIEIEQNIGASPKLARFLGECAKHLYERTERLMDAYYASCGTLSDFPPELVKQCRYTRIFITHVLDYAREHNLGYCVNVPNLERSLRMVTMYEEYMKDYNETHHEIRGHLVICGIVFVGGLLMSFAYYYLAFEDRLAYVEFMHQQRDELLEVVEYLGVQTDAMRSDRVE